MKKITLLLLMFGLLIGLVSKSQIKELPQIEYDEGMERETESEKIIILRIHDDFGNVILEKEV